MKPDDLDQGGCERLLAAMMAGATPAVRKRWAELLSIPVPADAADRKPRRDYNCGMPRNQQRKDDA